ncbi:MAG: cobyrinate a,c-diamide synthase [Marinifilaceae bacterium]
MKAQLLIGAPTSGTGKTTFTLGLLRAMRNRGLDVQAFKCGPDYIDTKYHSVAASRPSVNLDLFMSTKKHVNELYSKYTSDASVSIIEGVMGLFDGSNKMKNSSAEVAELLSTKVLLIVNAKAVAYSVAPLLYGFKNFYKNIEIAGVVFNFVSSESHYSFLKVAAEDVGIEPLGYIPRNEGLEIPSRHLGLCIEDENCFDDFADKVAVQIEKTVDVSRLLEIYSTDEPVYIPVKEKETSNLRIAVAKDDAFNFIYHENINALSKLGDIEFFSPMFDIGLPKDTDFVYLAGGYPELYMKELSNNTSMHDSIKEYCENGGRLLAECGGMMYLCDNIFDIKGNKFPMVGILNQDASMENMKLHLGYRRIMYENKEYRGHEFHYSQIINSKEKNIVGDIFTARDTEIDTKIFKYNNVLASYIHFYWGEKSILDLWK